MQRCWYLLWVLRFLSFFEPFPDGTSFSSPFKPISRRFYRCLAVKNGIKVDNFKDLSFFKKLFSGIPNNKSLCLDIKYLLAINSIQLSSS